MYRHNTHESDFEYSNDVRPQHTDEEYSRGIFPGRPSGNTSHRYHKRVGQSHGYDDDNEVLLDGTDESVPPLPPKDHHSIYDSSYRGFSSNEVWPASARHERNEIPQNMANDAFYNDIELEDRSRFSRMQYDRFSKPLPIITGPDELPPIPGEHDERSRRTFFGIAGSRKPIKWRQLPYFVYCMSIIQVCVFIYELAKMSQLTGSAIQTKPTFNPMIGPSTYVQTNLGSRFTPCMHYISGITDDTSIMFPCPNSTSTNTNVCTLSELCGMGGINPPGSTPKQWWRFITPLFIHAGFVHIGFNLLLQLTLGARLEREIGVARFVLVYLSSGIAGFILGGNFTPDGISSSGCSGCLFGVIAIDLLDLLLNWQLYQRPVFQLISHIIEIIISFVLGLLPGLDNFSHIGGFAMGLMTGIVLLRSPLKTRLVAIDNPINVPAGSSTDFFDRDEARRVATGEQGHQRRDGYRQKHEPRLQVAQFNWKDPMDGFRGRNNWWYGWLVVRVVALVLIVVYFVTLIRNFENGGGHCSWCKYLSCLPVNGWCDQGDIVETTTSSSS